MVGTANCLKMKIRRKRNHALKKRERRTTLHEMLCGVAWPWGEEKECTFWIWAVGYLPVVMAMTGISLFVVATADLDLENLMLRLPWQQRLIIWAQLCEAGSLEKAAKRLSVHQTALEWTTYSLKLTCHPLRGTLALIATILMIPFIALKSINFMY